MQSFNSKTCIETHVVSNTDKKIRLQDYAVDIFEAITTKTALKKSIKKGLITRDGKLANTGDWIEKGQVLKLYAEKAHANKRVFKLRMRVLYEDNDLATVLKPEGYPTNGNYFKTVENALPYNLQTSQAHDKLPYPQPVHRLDNPTSGVLLIAKTQSCKSLLSMLFERQGIQKQYVAVVEGDLSPGQGLLEMEVTGKASYTQYSLRYQVEIKGNIYSIVDLWPKTGRTHQLRIQLSYIGHPIVGDKEYGRDSWYPQLLLHAKSLQFVHPKTNKSLVIDTDLPHKFVKFMNAL